MFKCKNPASVMVDDLSDKIRELEIIIKNQKKSNR